MQHPYRPPRAYRWSSGAEEYRDGHPTNPIALITQHTTFLSDLPVGEFLQTHARIRKVPLAEQTSIIARTLAFANELTGEPIEDIRMTELSGGQTRALLLADATVVCDTYRPPRRGRERESTVPDALELLRRRRRSFCYHPRSRIALLADFRIVMEEGHISSVLHTDKTERGLAATVAAR